MAVALQHKEGTALAIADTGVSRIIKLVLREEYLELFEKANPAKMEAIEKMQQINVRKEKPEVESTFASSKLPVERTVEIDLSSSDAGGGKRGDDFNLGISVKGGADFHLPILISRITPGGKADRTNQIFVGDALLELNGNSLLGYTHKDAVIALQAAVTSAREANILRTQVHVPEHNVRFTSASQMPPQITASNSASLDGSCYVGVTNIMTLRLRYLPHAATILLNEELFSKKDRDSLNDSSQSSSATTDKIHTFQGIPKDGLEKPVSVKESCLKGHKSEKLNYKEGKEELKHKDSGVIKKEDIINENNNNNNINNNNNCNNNNNNNKNSNAIPVATNLIESVERRSRKQQHQQHNATSNSRNRESYGSAERIRPLPAGEYSYLYEGLVSHRVVKSSPQSWVLGLRLPLKYAFLSIFNLTQQGKQQQEEMLMMGEEKRKEQEQPTQYPHSYYYHHNQHQPHHQQQQQQQQHHHHQQQQQQHRYNSFIVRSLDGHSTGIISFKDPNQFHFWKEAVKFNINGLLINSMITLNKTIPRDKQIHYFGWLFCSSWMHGRQLIDQQRCHKYHESDYENLETINSGMRQIRIMPQKSAIDVSNNRREENNRIDEEPLAPSIWCHLFRQSSHQHSAKGASSDFRSHSQAEAPSKINRPTNCYNININNYNKSNNNNNNTNTNLNYSYNIANQQILEAQRNSIYSNQKIILNKPLFIVIQGIELMVFERPPICLNDWLKPLAKGLISRSSINYIGHSHGADITLEAEWPWSGWGMVNRRQGTIVLSGTPTKPATTTGMGNIATNINSSNINNNNNNNNTGGSSTSTNSSCLLSSSFHSDSSSFGSPLHYTSVGAAVASNSCFHFPTICPIRFLLQVENKRFFCVFDSVLDYSEFETIWIRINYYAIRQIKVDTFPCSYQNVDCTLCIDFDYGLKLVSKSDGLKIWQYHFHQLLASSDDGYNRLRLIFADINSAQKVDKILHCHNLDILLISIKSFLTAKLGQVDPHYFDR